MGAHKKLSAKTAERVAADIRFAVDQLHQAAVILEGIQAYHQRAREAITRAGAAMVAEIGEDEWRRIMDSAKAEALARRSAGDA